VPRGLVPTRWRGVAPRRALRPSPFAVPSITPSPGPRAADPQAYREVVPLLPSGSFFSPFEASEALKDGKEKFDWWNENHAARISRNQFRKCRHFQPPCVFLRRACPPPPRVPHAQALAPALAAVEGVLASWPPSRLQGRPLLPHRLEAEALRWWHGARPPSPYPMGAQMGIGFTAFLKTEGTPEEGGGWSTDAPLSGRRPIPPLLHAHPVAIPTLLQWVGHSSDPGA